MIARHLATFATEQTCQFILMPRSLHSWLAARKSVLLTTAIIVMGFILSFVSIATIATQHGGVFGPDTPVGWPNRIGIMSGCAWLMIVSWRAMSTKW